MIYSLIYAVAMAVVLPFEYRKRPRELRRRWLREKFGFQTEGEGGRSDAGRTVWIHAVSVGEVLASVPFIKALREKHPLIKVVVSTVTDTGQAIARQRLKGIANVIYMPLDLRSALKRAIRKIQPCVFICMETEMWPNAFATMKASNVPVVLCNGRISDSSYQGYKKIKIFIRRVLANVDLFLMQDQTYADRIKDLGARPEAVKVTGNLKFDISIKAQKPAWAGGMPGPVVVAGSTHRGEDGLIIAATLALLAEFPGLKLVLAPRHPERFKEVEELLIKMKAPYLKRTSLDEGDFSELAPDFSGGVVLLDSIGELFSTYAIADIAVMGGSFIEHGGQNPLEPAFWSKPVLCGPHMENFPFMPEMYSQGGAASTDEQGLGNALRELLNSPEKSEQMGKAARRFYEQNSGAVEMSLKLIEGYIS